MRSALPPALSGLLLALCVSTTAAQRSDTAASPFAGFETRILGNGLKVWFKQAKGVRDVAVSVTVPVGSGDDPAGKEQLAHFAEHMAFTDHGGKTEEQIKQEIDQRGGHWNASTWSDHTFYYAHIARQHGPFAIRWLYGIVSPKETRPAIVEKERDPVLIEVGARPRGIDDWVNALLVDPPLLRTAGYWKREFGIDAGEGRDIDLWRSTHSIDSADLRRFYEKNYSPATMTLTIIGDLPADSVWGIIDTTFARLTPRPVPPPRPALVDPHRERRFFQWQFGSTIRYREVYKTYSRSVHDDLVLAFLDQYLVERLNDVLRFGAHKAVYGIGVSNSRRGQAGQFEIGARVKRGELAYARATVDSEISRLRAGTVSDSEFRAVQQTVTSKIRSSTNTAVALEAWINEAGLYDRDEFKDFPDFLTQMSLVSKADVQAVARKVFVPEHHYLSIFSLVPVPHTVAYLVIALLVFLTVQMGRAVLIRPVPMTRLRYVARLKSPLLYRVVAVLVYCLVVLIALRVAIYIGIFVAEHWVLPIDSFVVQWTLMAIVSAAGLFYLIGAASLIPSKVLVFETGIAIKSIAYRSKWIRFSDIAALSMRRAGDVIRERGLGALRSTWFMTPALLQPALFLRLKSGRAYFIESRDTVELLRVLEEAKLRSESVAAPDDAMITSPLKELVREGVD